MMDLNCRAMPPSFPDDDFMPSIRMYGSALRYQIRRAPMPYIMTHALCELTPREKLRERTNEARKRYLKKRSFTSWNSQFRIVGHWSWARVFKADRGMMGAQIERGSSLGIGERNTGLP